VLRAVLAHVALAALAVGCAVDAGAGDDRADELADATPVASVAEVQQLLDEVRADVFPDLASHDIRLVGFAAAGDFYRADVVAETALRRASRRTYRVRYNTTQFGDAPSRAAVRAILVHEVKHIWDMAHMSSLEVAGLGLETLFGDTRAYERATDRFALEQGYARGLKAYRLWIYDHVDDATEAEKRATYYTPEEIDAWIAAHAGDDDLAGDPPDAGDDLAGTPGGPDAGYGGGDVGLGD
jgi:hypothetical protein